MSRSAASLPTSASPAAATTSSALSIVVVEDEPLLRQALLMALSANGHRVRAIGDGSGLAALLRDEVVDIVVLDLGLPGEDGIAIARRLRHSWDGGIVMVTARSQIDERILGMDSGADLYFSKPVDFRELDAGLRSLGRRLRSGGARPADAWHFDAAASSLRTPGGVDIPLTARECLLCGVLVAAAGNNVDRATIFAALGDPDNRYADMRLERMVSRLRAKVREMDPGRQLPIRARHNMGYAFLPGES